MKLFRKIIATVVIVITISSVCLALISYYEFKNVVIVQNFAKLDSLVNAKKNETTALLNGKVDLLRSIASNVQLKRILSDRSVALEKGESIGDLSAMISDTKKTFQDQFDIAILSTDEKLIASTKEDLKPFEIRRISDLITEESKEEAVSLDKKYDDILVLGPIISSQGERLGFAILFFSWNIIKNVTSDYLGLGDTGEVILGVRNEFGDAVFINSRRFEDRSDTSLIIDKDALDTPIIQALMGSEVMMNDATDYRGEEVMAVTRYIPQYDIGIVVKVDKKEIFSHFNKIQTNLILGTILSVCVASLLVMFIVSKFIKPLEVISDIAGEISSGNLEITIPHQLMKIKDETGLLANSMSTMISSLSGLYKNMEKKVKDRTVELLHAKNITEERFHEAERLNKIMISRELKMIELKKELAEIKARYEKNK